MNGIDLSKWTKSEIVQLRALCDKVLEAFGGLKDNRPIQKQIDVPFDESNAAQANGWHAAKACQGANPYPEKSPQYYDWNIGWRAHAGF